MNDNLLIQVPSERLFPIQEMVFLGDYVLKPLRLKFIHKSSIHSFLTDTLQHYPDIMIGRDTKDFYIIMVVMPSNQEDYMVLMALSKMLLRLTYGSLPEGGYRLEDRVDSFYNNIKQMKKVDRLYRIDLSSSLTRIPISLVLRRVSSLVSDRTVYKLIESFLNLPIIDDTGKYRDDISKGGMPPAGEITRVFFNIVLMEVFDKEFEKRYPGPGIAFTRFNNEVFISETRDRGNQSSRFNEYALYGLLKELNLRGQVDSIEPGDEPLPCYKKVAVLNTMGGVNICDPKTKAKER